MARVTRGMMTAVTAVARRAVMAGRHNLLLYRYVLVVHLRYVDDEFYWIQLLNGQDWGT